MKIKLSSLDMVEITKSLKGGWIDLNKISCFKGLLDGYNPRKRVSDKELHYYLERLRKGWGYKPNDESLYNEMIDAGVTLGMLDKDKAKVFKNEWLYRQMVKEAFIGLLSIKALGGEFYDVEQDFSFIDETPPKF